MNSEKTGKKDPLRVAIIGMGGFAGHHQKAVRRLEEEGEFRLVASCDPNFPGFAEAMEGWDFTGRGVKVFGDYLEMLDACESELDMVVIPTPIQFHSEMHRECVNRGLPVYLEKPPSLYLRELEEMIETDRRQEKKTNIGFNFIVESQRLELKRRVLAGDFGRLLRVGYRGLGARSANYFQRNNWAGRIRVGDKVVLDSCMGNAMAHHVHNSLFWAGGKSLFSWSPIESVRAEIYRANKIENADSFFVSAETTSGVKIDLAITHACGPDDRIQEEILWFENAVIRYYIFDRCTIEWADGRIEEIPLPREDLLPENHRFFGQYLRGERDRPATSLEDSVPFVSLYNLAYVSSGGISTVPGEFLSTHDVKGEEVTAVNEISRVMEEFIERGELPSSQGIPWANRPRKTARGEDVYSVDDVIRSLG